jgi:methionyl-tRNA formyltransferase
MMKNLLIFSDPSDNFSLKMVDIINKSNLFKICIVITTKKQKKNVYKLEKILSNQKSIIFCDGFPHKNKQILRLLGKKKIQLGISTGFSNLIRKKFLNQFKEGVINIHPAFLPFNKGSHAAFWSILNSNPYGSSLHYMNERFDCGHIIDRIKIKNDLFKTAEDIFAESRIAGINLLKKNLKKIYKGRLKKIKNKNSKINFKREIKEVVNLDLKQNIKVKKLWALIRATKFKKHGIIFNVKNKKFKVVSTIEKI